MTTSVPPLNPVGEATTPRFDRRSFLTLFAAVMLPMVMAAADQSLLATATPSIAAELGGLRDTAWISVAYLIAVTVMVPVYGRLGDRLGRSRVLSAALLVFASGSLACALAPNMSALIAARVVQGLGGGGLMVMSQALVGEVVPPRDRPRIQGYLALNFALSSVGGPLIGGFVVTHADWRWLFYANLPLVALALWRLRRMPPQLTPVQLDRTESFDAGGLLMFALATVATLLWINFGGHRFEWISAPSLVLLAVATVFWMLLVHRERTAAHPFLPIEMLANSDVRAACATVVCMGGAVFALLYFLPLYLQLGHGVNASQSGALLVPLMIGIAVGSTLTGRWVARTQRAGVLPRYGLALAAAGIGAIALIEPGLSGTAALCAVAGIGLGTVMPNAQIVIQTLGGRAHLGASAAIVSLARSVGAAVGTAMFSGLFFALLYGTSTAQSSAAAPSASQVLQASPLTLGALAVWLAAGAWFASRAHPVPLDPKAAQAKSAAVE